MRGRHLIAQDFDDASGVLVEDRRLVGQRKELRQLAVRRLAHLRVAVRQPLRERPRSGVHVALGVLCHVEGGLDLRERYVLEAVNRRILGHGGQAADVDRREK